MRYHGYRFAMKTICAWCGITLKDEGGSYGLVSHGICLPCAVKIEMRGHILEPWKHRLGKVGSLKKAFRRALHRSIRY